MPGFDFSDPATQTTAAILLLGVAIIAWMLWYGLRRPKGWKPFKYVPPPPPVEVARIEEIVTLTGGGQFAQVLLALHNLFMAMMFVFSARSAVQEASLGTIWIAGNVLWGACMFMGRRSSYRVLRETPPPDPKVE